MAGETNPDPVLSYAFNANAPAGSPLSYQSLLTRRKIAEALLGKRDQMPFPKNLGEGLTYASARLADAFGDRSMLGELDAAERRQAAGEAALRASFDTPSKSTAPPSAAASGVPPVPYTPSGEGSVPLPPPRPVVDRSPIIDDANDPATARRLAAITLGEGNPGASEAELQQQYESTVNRGMQVGLPNAIKTYTGPGSGGYYPPDAIARGEQRLQQPGAYESFRERIARPILRGATDPLGLGFSPTQNASLGVADRGSANGTYSQFARSPTGELFARKPGEAPLPRFSAGGPDTDPGNTGPDLAGPVSPTGPAGGRDAITAAVLSKTPIEQQPLMGGAPGAPVQTASLGPPAPGGGAPDLPPSYLSPNLLTALPPAPYANPVIPAPPGLVPRPVQTAQAPTAQRPPSMTPQDIYKEQVLTPSAVIHPHPGPEVPIPKVPAPTEQMQRLANVATSGNVSEQMQNWAKGRYQELKDQQTKQYEQDFEEYKFKRTKREADLSKHEESVRNLPIEEAKLQKGRLETALAVEKDPLTIQQMRGQIAELDQKLEAGVAPKDIKFDNGKYATWDQSTRTWKDITPQVNPLDIQVTGEEGKKVEFYIRAKNASTELNSDAKSLTNLGSALATRRLGLLGNYLVDPKFQIDYNRAKAWGMAVLRDESGAALPVKEIESKMDTYWPLPGDNPATIADKAQKRRAEETSFYLSLGKARPLADFYVERRTDQPEGKRFTDPQTGKKYVVKNGLMMDAQ